MSDLVSIADAVRRRSVRTGFDTANPGMPPALEISHGPPNLRHYAPHPCAPTDEELAAQAYGDRTLDEIESDMFGQPATGPL